MTRDHETKPDDSHSDAETSSRLENPPPAGPHKKGSPFGPGFLERAAYEQLAGPFGKLGRYALKQQGGLTIPERREALRGESEKAGGVVENKEGLFRRLVAFFKPKRP